MYNEELKRKFILEYSQNFSSQNAVISIFESIAPYELACSKDVSTFSVDELQPVVDDVLGVRSGTKAVEISILRKYVKWCMAAGIPGICDSVWKIGLLGIEKVRQQFVSGPAQLQSYLDCVFDPVEEETVDIIYRCFLWLAFIGIKENDVFLVRSKDINYNNMTIWYDDEEMLIPREAVPAFKHAINLSQFKYVHPKYTTYIDRVDGEMLLRGLRDNNAKADTMRPVVSKHTRRAYENKKTEKLLNYHRIWLSGWFYRIYEMERSDGLEPKIRSLVDADMNGKVYKLGRGETMEAKRRRKIKRYSEDYHRWKFAFSV